jgi:hypothetical protein
VKIGKSEIHAIGADSKEKGYVFRLNTKDASEKSIEDYDSCTRFDQPYSGDQIALKIKYNELFFLTAWDLKESQEINTYEIDETTQICTNPQGTCINNGRDTMDAISGTPVQSVCNYSQEIPEKFTTAAHF